MKKRFRVISLLLTASMLLTTACGANDKKEKIDDKANKVSIEGMEKNSEVTELGSLSGYVDDESEEYEIIWYYIGNTDNADHDKVQEKVSEYTKEKINATVKMIPLDWSQIEGDTAENIMASGEKYDLMWRYSSYYQNSALKGAFLEIDDLMKEYAPKTREQLGEEFVDGARIDGKLYGVQALKDNAKWYSIAYRKDIADKYDMDLSNVTSLEDMYPYFDIIVENEPEMYAYGMGGGKTPWSIADVDTIGGNGLVGILSDDDEIANLVSSDLYLECALQSREMYERGYVYKEASVDDNIVDLRAAGRIFAYVSSDRPGQIEEINAAGSWGPGEWATIVLTEDAISDTGCAIPSLQCISITSENPARVMKFLELVNTDAYLKNLIDFGIEGEHYTKVSDTRIELISDSGYKCKGSYIMGNVMMDYLMPGESDTKYEDIKQFNDTAVYTVGYGFLPNFENVNIQYSNCLNVYNEFNKAITYGSVEPEAAIEEFNEKLKAAGIDEVVEEAQKQYEEWKATK